MVQGRFIHSLRSSKRRACRRCSPPYRPVDVRPLVICLLIAVAVLMGIALLVLIA
ncbi:hypothetical protein SynA1528_01192 [Synechococcus sp. A15-28]|jgi:hypothetical protein|nr:hypothetical protein SynA1528_01192 [Synechococcus sp. A15-28]